MSRYQFTPQAEDDLFAIWSFIARDSIESADRVESEILRSCDWLAESPFAGQIRSDLTERAVRFWVVPRYSNYLIVYHPSTKPLQIIRIIHGRRNMPNVLG